MDKKIVYFNNQGLIPGPNESEDSFFNRAEYCLRIKEKLKESLDPQSLMILEMIKESHPETEKFYDIAPDWVPLVFDNHKLAFWHGGCAWIFQLEENSPISAILQLRKKYTKAKKVIKRKEILVHELAHVGRMAFEEPKYEEILAYRSSKSKFRAYFGAIASSSIETGVFVLILILIGLLDLFFIFSGYSDMYLEAQWLKLIPMSMIVYGILRLTKRQRTLNKCLLSLEKIAIHPNKASAIAYRLTDKEIEMFATMTSEEIKKYFKTENETSLRLKLISNLYLQPSSYDEILVTS